MSASTYKAAALVVVAVLVLTGCGTSAAPGRRRSSAVVSAPSTAGTWPCLARLHAREATAGSVPIGVLGTGRRAVVLSEESDQDACGWLAVVTPLERAGLRVLVYDYATDPVDDLTSVLRYARAHGATSTALLGASEGAKTSIVAAAKAAPAVSAVVSLSAEAALQGVEVAPYARRLRAPTLFVTAADDAYGSTPATRGFYRSAPARTKQLIVVPGSAHGTALLASASVRSTVVTFLAAHDG